MKRLITQREEQALRLTHHDFDGLTIKRAAKQMDTTPTRVRRLLSSVKKKAPTLFPILTPTHRAILAMYDKGDSREIVAEALGLSLASLERRVTFLRERGHLRDRRPDQYCPWMDVKEKF